jgi:shikimate kinase
VNANAGRSAENSLPRPILIGYRATGKSTLAADLARKIGCRQIDADDAFEAACGCSIASFIGDRGENAFRDAETALLRDLLGQPDTILATGGGVILRPENRLLLRQAGRPVVWLTAPVTEIRRRLAADPTTSDRRPALSGGDVLDEVEQALAQRERWYREVADTMFDTTAVERNVLVASVCRWLDGWQSSETGERSDGGGKQ